jgi:hypothetical protein
MVAYMNTATAAPLVNRVYTYGALTVVKGTSGSSASSDQDSACTPG